MELAGNAYGRHLFRQTSLFLLAYLHLCNRCPVSCSSPAWLCPQLHTPAPSRTRGIARRTAIKLRIGRYNPTISFRGPTPGSMQARLSGRDQPPPLLIRDRSNAPVPLPLRLKPTCSCGGFQPFPAWQAAHIGGLRPRPIRLAWTGRLSE